jgi:uncharacterized protein
MRVSRFNVIHKTSDITYGYNSFTGALAKLHDDFFSILDYIDAGKDESKLSEKDVLLLKNMKYAGFVIDDSLDEIGRLAEIQQKQRANMDNLHLTIAPTLSCNFGCPYCFETAKPGLMQQDVQQAVFGFIQNQIEVMRPKNISITWYGGEPLLAKDIVVFMSRKIDDIAKAHSMTSRFDIITNGYLIDEAITEQFFDNGIRQAQITIDGCEERHNHRRFLRSNPEKGTYDQILRGINLFAQCGIKVGIRMNVDKENMGDIGTFVREMNAKIANTENITINLGHVFDFSTNELSHERNNCISTEQFADCKIEMLKLFKDIGLSASIKDKYPRLMTDCGATTKNSFVINPDGKIYLCWSDISIDSLSIGSVFYPLDFSSEKCRRWSECSSILTNAKCVLCEVLPICMGGCPRERVYRGKKADCTEMKYSINRLIAFFAQENKLFEKGVSHGTHH